MSQQDPTSTDAAEPIIDKNNFTPEELKEVQRRVSEARINKAVADILGKDADGSYDNNCQNIGDGIDTQTPAAKQKLIEKRSRLPYYKEFYGRESLAILKIVKDSGKNRIIKYNNYPTLARGSILNRINQGIYYVQDHFDPTGEWHSFLKTIEIRKAQIGILFFILRQDLGESSMLVTEEAADEIATFGKLKSYIREIIEKMPVDTQYSLPDDTITDVSLTREQVEELVYFFEQSPDLLAKVKKDSIMIMKPSSSGVEEKGV